MKKNGGVGGVKSGYYVFSLCRIVQRGRNCKDQGQLRTRNYTRTTGRGGGGGGTEAGTFHSQKRGHDCLESDSRR